MSSKSVNISYTRKKYTFEIVLITFFLLLSQPFLFSVYLGPEISYLICGSILAVLALKWNASKNISKNLSFLLIGLFVYFLLHLAFRTNYVFYTLLSIFDLLFFIVVIQILKRNDNIKNIIIRWLHFFALLVSIMIIGAWVFYTYYPGVFYHTDNFAGYHGFFNPIFGMINDDKLRPSWYFAEPSYSGFFLGFNFLIALNQKYPSKTRKFLVLLCLLAGIIITSSTGAYVYLLVSLLVFVVTKFKLSKGLIQIMLYSGILVSLLIIPKMDSYGLLTLAVERNEASFISRQNRMEIANATKAQMSTFDIIIGKGASYVTLKHEEGLSDAYNKLYIEYGLVFLLVFLLAVRKLTVNNLPLHCFVFLSFLSVVICLAPINLICYYLADTDNS